jgi:hypothetical protein
MVRASLIVLHLKLSFYFFGKIKKKFLQEFPILGSHLSQVREKSLCARIYARVLEEVEEYKNNFVFILAFLM